MEGNKRAIMHCQHALRNLSPVPAALGCSPGFQPGPFLLPPALPHVCSTLTELRHLSLEGCRGMVLLDAGLAAAAPGLHRLTSLNLQARRGSKPRASSWAAKLKGRQ